MNTLDATEYSRMRSTAEETFLDACRLGSVPDFTYGGTSSAPPEPSYGNEQACGFSNETSAIMGEAADGSQAPIFDATLRLPTDTVVDSIDRVQITKRHGSTLATAETYAVEGKPALGPSAIVLNLKLITGNSSL